MSPLGSIMIEGTPSIAASSIRETHKPVLLKEIEPESNWYTADGQMINSCIGTPITFGEKLLGFLVLMSSKQNYFNQAHIARLQAFVNQAGVAIRNAQLYTEAQEVASLEERQRLAREMHDVISQTLFSLSIKAEALSYLYENEEPAAVKENLTELNRLARGALAEMRTLLMELRPSTIINTDMGNLLKQMTDGLASRTTTEITLKSEGHGLLPPDVQTAFFRIIQEAINNLVKHSRACKVEFDFSNNKDLVRLRMYDDGCGFMLSAVPSERMGIRIMRERAEAIGAEFTIESEPGRGTSIEIRWSKLKYEQSR